MVLFNRKLPLHHQTAQQPACDNVAPALIKSIMVVPVHLEAPTNAGTPEKSPGELYHNARSTTAPAHHSPEPHSAGTPAPPPVC